MSTKRFCDYCGGEIGGDYTTIKERVVFRPSQAVTITVQVEQEGAREDICSDCVLDALAKLDNRPQGVEAR